jgi:hypothetical protein
VRNFCGFGLKRRHLIFADFFSADCKSCHRKKMFVLQEAITVILRSKNIFSSLESFQMTKTAEISHHRNYRLYGNSFEFYLSSKFWVIGIYHHFQQFD